jgi:RNA polymerase sigma factor (sigma-70 family)
MPAMQDDLRDTVSSAAAGDGLAIDALLARMLPGLRDFLAREAGALVRAKESVSDLAQSVCREVLEQLRDERLEYRGEAQFVRWLQQAAVHKLQNRHRFYGADKRDARREVPPADSAGGPADAAQSATPSRAFAAKEASAQLEQALAQLPERDRLVIRLCHFEGRSHDDVAAQLGITPSHSRVLLARALARLARTAR